MTVGGESVDTPNDIVESFANFFGSVYQQSNNFTAPQNDIPLESLSNISIAVLSESDILTSLKLLKNKPTAGCDDIPSFIIRDCANVFVAPLLTIFNLSLRTSTYPDAWKVAKICPIFKGGNSSEVKDYRPISIIPNFSKAFERCIYDKIFPQVRPLINLEQHGFINNRSTVTNLACFLQYAHHTIGDKQQLDVVYTDFSKAFDKMDHGILCRKMHLIGFHPKLIQFFQSYLHNRQQFVAYNGYLSDRFVAVSGAPQGSNLAPLLFSIFINDITCGVSSKVLMFADDLKIFRVIRSYDDCVLLQEDLQTISMWCATNKLPLNTKKCKKITISLKSNEIPFDYTLEDNSLEHSDCVRDLGVYIDKKLNFNYHINEITQNALKTLGFLIRSTHHFCNHASLITLYNTLVKPKLDYATVVWSPIYNSSIDKLEYVQRRFLKYLSFKVDGVYPQRGANHLQLLNRFEFLSLKNVRILRSLIFLYKLCNNMIDSPGLLHQLNFLVPTANTRSQNVFYPNTPNTNLASKAPLHQACLHLNDINSRVGIDMFHCTITVFKKSVLDCLKNLQKH